VDHRDIADGRDILVHLVLQEHLDPVDHQDIVDGQD
jgi:hypothetical protein